MTPLGFVVIIKRTGIEGFRYPLQQATCLLGRGAECDIRIQLPVVSKQQCKIEFDQQLKEAVLINLNSVNPTRLNGVTFARPTKLVHGDVITIVDRSFRFEYGSGSASENTPIKPSEPKSKEVTPTQSRSSSISTLISDQYQRRTVQVFKNIHAKYTEENISRQFSLLQSLEAKIIANKSKNQDASNNMGDHRPGKTPTLESKELKESATGSSEGDVSQVSTPEHPGKSKKNTNSPFKQLFGLMREELNSKCQQIGDHLNRKSEPIQVSMSGREWETELLHLPRSKPIRRSEVVRISQNWQEPQQKGQEAVAALSKEEGASKGSSSAKGAESAQTQEHKSPRAKRRKSQSLLTPVKTSGKRKSKTGSGKDKQKSVSGTCEGSPLQEAQSPQTLYTLRSQTKKPEASPLGNDKEAAMAAKTTPAEKLVLKQSDPNGGSETTNLAQKKGSPKGNKSADTQLNPKRASNSDQILKKIQDELYFEDNVSESEESSAKRRRVSFGVHLRPELFDENLPPNTPLKRGETPGLRRTSLGRTVLRKSIIKLTSEKEASSSAGHLEPKASLDQLSPKPTTTAPKEARSPSCLPTTKAKSTPVVGSQPRKTSRRSSSGRRSQHEALQTIFAKRRSGASEANLMVVQSWADVVKLGTKKSQGEVVVKHGLERRRIKKQKRCLTPKKPANQAQNHFSTGHANSPCTIVIGKAHTEKVMAPAQPYRVFNNLVLNSKVDMNEDLTGLDEMFRTPMSEKQKTANVCPESPTPQLLSGEKAKLAHTSSDEALVSTSDKLAEKVISNTQDKAKQTSGQIIPCRRSPRNRHSMGDDEIIKTPKEISEIRGDEIMETLPPEVDVDHKKLTPSTKRLKTCTPKEVGPTPYLNRNSESAAQGEGALVEDHPKTPVASRVSKFEDRFPGTPNIEEKVKENSANNLKNQKPKMVPQVGITASFKIKEPFVIDIQKHTRTSLQKQYSSSDAQGTVAITSQQHELSSMKKPERTPKEKGPIEDLTGIRELMTTPIPTEDRIDEKLRISKQVCSAIDADIQKKPMAIKQQMETEDVGSIKEFIKTPKRKCEPVEPLTAVKRLMRTPKDKVEPREDKVSYERLMKTPKEKEPVESQKNNQNVNVRQMPKTAKDPGGLRRCVDTPKEKIARDLTDLMTTPKQVVEPVKDQVSKTTMMKPEQKVESVENLTEIKVLIKTPKEKEELVEDRKKSGKKLTMRSSKEKREVVEDSVGIKKIKKTKASEQVEDVTGLGKPSRTSKEKKKIGENLALKKLMRIRKGKIKLVEDLTGLKKLQTPEEKGEPDEDLTGIKRLMQTPNEKGEPDEDLTGIKRLMQTPKEKGEIEKNFTNVAVFMETSKNNISSTHTLRQNYPKEITDRDSVVSEILYEIETLRRPAIKDVSVSNQESQTIEKTPELLPEVPTRVVRGVIASKSLKPPRKNKLVGEEDICRANPKSKESSSEVNCDYNESKDKSVEQCQRQICFNPCESDYISETERDLSNVTNDIFPEKEKEKFLPHIQDKVKGIIENQRTITLRSRSKIKSGKEPEGSVHLLRSTRVHLKNSEKTVKTPWEENVKEKVEQSSSLTQSSEVKPSEEEKKETLEDLRGKSGDMSGNMERMAPFQPRRNQASKETQSSSLSDMSDLENSENNSPRKNLRVRLKDAALNEGRASTLRSKKTNKDSPCESDVSYTDDEMKLGKRLPRKPNVPPRFSSRNKTTKELQETGPLGSEIETLSSENGEERGIMGALRSRNRNKVDTEWQEPSSSLSDIISHTGRDEKKPMKVVLKEEKLKAQITSSGISLRSRKKNKEMLNFGDLAPDSDKTYTDEEKESVKSLPEKLKGQRILVESRNRNISVIEINEYDSLSSESPTKNEKYAGVNEDKVALRTRSRNKDKASEEKQESKTTDISCIENKGKKAKGLQAQWNTTFLRTKTRIEATKESQEPDSLPTEAGKPHTEDYEKPGEGKAFQDKSKNTDPSKGITKKKSKMDKESEGSIDSSRDTEINKPVKSFQENLINETMMSLRSQSKKKDTELSYLTKILSVENNEKMPRKNFPEKNILKESPVNEDKVPLRPRTVKSVAPEKLDPKDEKNPGKGQKNLNDTTGSGGMSLRSRNKSKMETVGLNENPVSTSEKDAEKSINTSSRMLKNSLIPQETLGRSRNKIGPQESCRLPSATEVVLVEEDDKKTLSQKNLGKKLNLRVGGLDPHKTRNRNKADQELYNNSLHNVTEMTDTEANQEKMEKILKDQIVTKDLVPRRPRLTNKNNKEVKESAGKDEKENVAQIFPNKGIDRTSLRTRLRNRSDTDLQKSANLNKKDSFNDAKTTTGKAPNGKQIDFAFLENKRGNSRIANIKEPTNSIQEGHFVKVGQVPDKAFKVILTSAKNTQSEPTLLRERSMLLKRSTSQTQKCNDTNSQERTLRFRRKCTLKQTEVLTTSSKQSNINPKLMKNIKA